MGIIKLVDSIGNVISRLRGTPDGAGYVAEVGLAAQPHNREIEGITDSIIGTFLIPAGVFGYQLKFTGGTAGDEMRVVEDATPVDPIELASVTVANPAVFTTKTDHNLQTGDLVSHRSITGWSVVDPNGQYTVTVTGAKTYTVGLDTSTETGTYNNGLVIDLEQANTWLAVSSTVDPELDIQYQKFSARSNLDNEGWCEERRFDAASEGLRRIDILATVVSTVKAEMRTT